MKRSGLICKKISLMLLTALSIIACPLTGCDISADTAGYTLQTNDEMNDNDTGMTSQESTIVEDNTGTVVITTIITSDDTASDKLSSHDTSDETTSTVSSDDFSSETSSADTASKNTAYSCELLWAKSYGGSAGDCGLTLSSLPDGGIAAGGYSKSFGNSTEFYLIRTDSDGNLQWDNVYGGSDHDLAYSLAPISDGGFIMTGEKRIYSILDEFNLTTSYKYDISVVKTDNLGNELWSEHYGGDDYDRGNRVIECDDGGYLIAGHTQSYGAHYDPEPHAKKDLWIIKLDTRGNLLWETLYGGDESDGAVSVQQTRDDGFIVCGFTASYGAGSYDGLILKLDQEGSIEWGKTYGGERVDIINDIVEMPDGGYMAAGETMSSGNGYSDFYVLRLDRLGNVIWEKTFGGGSFERARSLTRFSETSWLVAGYTSSFGKGNKDMWLIKLNASGEECWSTTIGSESCDEAFSVDVSPDGSIFLCGNTSSFGAGEIDYWIVKLREISK